MTNTQKIIEALEAQKAVIIKEIELLDDKSASQSKAVKLLKANAEKSKNRKSDNQRKYIIGAVISKEMQRNQNFKNQILEFLRCKVTSDRDRKILELDDSRQTNKQTNE